MMTTHILVLLAAILILAAALEQPTLENLSGTVPLDFDEIPFSPVNAGNGIMKNYYSGFYSSTGKFYSTYTATFAPEYFSFYPPTTSGCTANVKTSNSSAQRGCDYATNGAFFNSNISATGSLCNGNLISDGHIWQLPTDGSGTGRANFGITADNNFVVGFVDSATISSRNFTQLITGWGWLVRNGESWVQSSADLSFSNPTGFTYEKAPRTAVGMFKNGSMVLAVADGEEDIFWGPNLFEMAEFLVSIGVHQAVNIDGGGSSVAVANGMVVDQPTCKDTPALCERSVTSFACVREALV